MGDPHRPRRRGPRALPDHGGRHPQPHEVAGDPRHGGVRGQGVPHRALGLRVHRRLGGRPAPHQAGRQGGRRRRERRQRGPGRRRRSRSRRSTCTCSSARRRRSASAATGRPTKVSPSSSAPVGSRSGWRTSARSCSGAPSSTISSTTGGPHHMAKVTNPAIEPGMAPEDIARRVEEFDYSVMEEHRTRIDEIVADPAVAEGLKPYYRYLCKRPLLPRRVPRRVQQPERDAGRLPGRCRADHRAQCLRQRQGVRARLHRLRHRLRSRVHAVRPARRPHDHRARRRHDGGEVEGRRDQPARHDDARLPEHVHHAGARAAGRHHGQLHAPDGPRRRAHRGDRRAARGARREGVRRDARRPRRPGPRRSSAPPATTARSWPRARPPG